VAYAAAFRPALGGDVAAVFPDAPGALAAGVSQTSRHDCRAPNFAYELCVRKIADKDIKGVDLSSWRAALNGAEPVNPETLERFAERFASYGFRREAQLPVYGLAEASLAVTVPPLNRGPLVDRVERETFTAQGRAIPAALRTKRQSPLFLPEKSCRGMKFASWMKSGTTF